MDSTKKILSTANPEMKDEVETLLKNNGEAEVSDDQLDDLSGGKIPHLPTVHPHRKSKMKDEVETLLKMNGEAEVSDDQLDDLNCAARLPHLPYSPSHPFIKP